MNLGEFIKKLIRNYLPESTSQTRIEEVFNDYYKELSTCGNCDYDKAYSEIFRTYDKVRMPNAAYLIEVLNKYRVITSENGMTCPVQIINFNVLRDGKKREYAFSTATDNYEELKRKHEKLGDIVITDKYGNDLSEEEIRDNNVVSGKWGTYGGYN